MKQKYKLKVGDVIYVDNPLLKEEYRRYEVEKIIGNRAITKFRDFNTEIYFNNRIYEYGKRLNGIYNNDYFVERLG